MHVATTLTSLTLADVGRVQALTSHVIFERIGHVWLPKPLKLLLNYCPLSYITPNFIVINEVEMR
jgi:hypothetical protein